MFTLKSFFRKTAVKNKNMIAIINLNEMIASGESSSRAIFVAIKEFPHKITASKINKYLIARDFNNEWCFYR